MKSVTDCRKWLFCSLACFFTAFLIAVSANTCKQEADASRIAPYGREARRMWDLRSCR